MLAFDFRVSTKSIKINSRIIPGFFKANRGKFQAETPTRKNYNHPV